MKLGVHAMRSDVYRPRARRRPESATATSHRQAQPGSTRYRQRSVITSSYLSKIAGDDVGAVLIGRHY